MAVLLRAETDKDPNRVLVALDGVGAYDHCKRKAMLQKLKDTPSVNALLPFVRQFYGQQSRYLWTDAKGRVHDVVQGEGCEQGDALSPALFSLGFHDALKAEQEELPAGDFLVAYLDDVCLCTTREHAKRAFDTTRAHLQRHSGIRVHLGKHSAGQRQEV